MRTDEIKVLVVDVEPSDGGWCRVKRHVEPCSSYGIKMLDRSGPTHATHDQRHSKAAGASRPTHAERHMDLDWHLNPDLDPSSQGWRHPVAMDTSHETLASDGAARSAATNGRMWRAAHLVSRLSSWVHFVKVMPSTNIEKRTWHLCLEEVWIKILSERTRDVVSQCIDVQSNGLSSMLRHSAAEIQLCLCMYTGLL